MKKENESSMQKLSKEEMKKIMGGGGGSSLSPIDGNGGGCITQYGYDCSLTNSDPDLTCCPGLKCEMNATNSGTICM